MKLVIDEKLKHRLIGLAVIISLGAIFAPAIMKKSDQHIDGNISVNVKLPTKPVPPDVVMTDEKELFRTIKVAKVDIAPVSAEPQVSGLVKAEPVKSDLIHANKSIALTNAKTEVKSAPIKTAPVQLALHQAAQSTVKKAITVASAKPTKSVKPAPVIAAKQKPAIKPAKTTKAAPKSTIKKDIYAVQLASFSQISNAKALVNRLRGKGYKANYMKVSSRQGPVYKVYVGNSPSKNDAVKLKTQLASSMQLNGFVVNTGVS